MLALPADTQIDRDAIRRPPAVLQVPRVEVVVVGRNDRGVVDTNLRWRVRHAANRVGVEDAIAGQVVRIAIRALVEINADTGLELVLAEERTIGEEADAVFRL